MRRQRKESTAVRHATPAIIVQEEDPIANHPSLGPLRDVRAKKIAKRSGKSKVHVAVKVEHDAG